MSRDERSYLERRAEQELDLAQAAAHPSAAKAHYDLMGHYLDRLFPDREAMSSVH